MRKTCQDGGDNTSITSGIEYEMKKCGPSILKSTKNSIKRKVHNFSTESDDTANEPLLCKSKEENEIEKQSAKLLLSKTNTEFGSAKDSEKGKLLADDKITKSSVTDVTGITDGSTSSGLKDLKLNINQSLSTVTIHNHMNTNVFKSSGELENTAVTKSQIVVEVDASKPSGYTPSPLIFNTAKIHTDGKMQQMEPLQVTPVPILSSIEGGVAKIEIKVKEFDKKKEVKPTESRVTDSNIPEKYDHVTKTENIFNASMKYFNNKNNDSKIKIITPLQQIPNTSKITLVESTRIKNDEPSVPSKDNKGAKIVETPISIHELQQVSNSNSIDNPTKRDFTKPVSTHVGSATYKSHIDINKNVHSEPKQDSGKKMEDKQLDDKVASFQPSVSKDDKTTTNVVSNTKENKSSNSQESKITTSKVKSSDHDSVLNITDTASTEKYTIDPISVSKENTKSSPDKFVAKSTNPGSFKPFTKAQTSNNATNMSLAQNSPTHSSNRNGKVDCAKNSNFKAECSPESIPNSSKSSETQSTATLSLTKSNIQCKTTVKETNPQSKPIDSKSSSNVSSISNASNNKKSTAVTFANISPEINKVPTTSAKTFTSTINKNLPNASITTSSSARGNSILSTSTSSILVTTADVSKLKSNNEATIVSSISKVTTTSLISKSIPSSSSSSMTKTTPTAKQLTSPSTVKTIISSAPTIKSAVVGPKGIPTTVKPMSTVSNNTLPASSMSKKPVTSKSASTVTVAPSAKVVATSTKPATKPSTQSGVKPK